MDGGFINSRLAAFGAALVTPVLLEFGALKWLLERHPVKPWEIPSIHPSIHPSSLKSSIIHQLYVNIHPPNLSKSRKMFDPYSRDFYSWLW